MQTTNNFSLKEEVFKYLFQWKWFVLGVILCVTSAYLYLRYSVPQYKANATILVKDDRKGGIANELSAFSDLGMLSNIKSNVDNEVEVIKSRALIQKTIEDLELTTVYMNVGRVKSEELYRSYPIKMAVLNADEKYINSYKNYRIEYNDANTFKLYNESDISIGVFKYGENIKVNEAVLQFIKTKDYNLNKEFNIAINYYPKAQLVESFRNRLLVSTLSKNTSVIELSIIDPVKLKAVDFLNELVENYNKDAIADKKYVSENTSKFIDQRLNLIAKELQNVEQDVEAFKKANQVTDIVSEAGLFLESATEVEKEKVANLTQIKVVETMMDYVNSSDFSETLPSNIIAQDQGATSLIADYNKLVLERNRLTKTAGEKNTLVKSLDAKITSLKQNVKESLAQYKISLEIQQNDLARQKAKVSGKISQIPTQERLFRDIDRKQHVKEALFLYLLQKREEMAISLAVTAPNAKVIDLAIASSVPVSPNRKLIYLGSLLLGLLIPFGIIYILNLFDTKIKSREDIERATTLPFLGEIPRLEEGTLLVENTSRSSTAEALRIVRTNLEFLLGEVEEKTAKTIFLTSTYPKEGKTFVSVNLASIISKSNDKVLLIGADIRNPKLDDYMKLPQKGLTNFLTDKTNASINDYIVNSKEIPNLHVLPAGIIPPNPAELLMSKKVDEMFVSLRKDFDYIIVDTAPVSLVTDTLIIAKNADAFLYVTRANFLDKRMLELPEKLYNEKKLPNMSILLNDSVVRKQYGYGYGYGYGYEAEKETKKSWKSFFKK